MEEAFPTLYKWKEITEFDILFRAKANQVAILAHRGFTVSNKQREQLTWTDYADYERKKRRFFRQLEREQVRKEKSSSHQGDTDVRSLLSQVYSKEVKSSAGETATRFSAETESVRTRSGETATRFSAEKIYVAFVTQSKGAQSIKRGTIDTVIAKARLAQAQNIMLITAFGVHQDALKYTTEGGLSFEIYSEKNMACNRLEHVLNPKIKILTDEEKREFLHETGLRTGQMARYEGWQREQAETAEPFLQHYQIPNGTIVQIVRENNYTVQAVNETFYARVVQ